MDLERFLDRVEAEERRKERRQRQQDLYEAAPKLTQRERVAVCGCVWRHFPEATQGWKWKCVKRCPEHDASAGHVVPQEPTS